MKKKKLNKKKNAHTVRKQSILGKLDIRKKKTTESELKTIYYCAGIGTYEENNLPYKKYLCEISPLYMLYLSAIMKSFQIILFLKLL